MYSFHVCSIYRKIESTINALKRTLINDGSMYLVFDVDEILRAYIKFYLECYVGISILIDVL